jgi:hypothetical protein
VRATIAPDASPEEVAAIVAALERFLADGSIRRGGAADSAAEEGWLRAALREGVRRESDPPLRDPWLDGQNA